MRLQFILIALLSLLLVPHTQSKAQHKSRYKPGFKFIDNHGVKVTLIKLVDQGFSYRWRAKFQQYGVTAYGYTDDCWIDLYTNKAFYNARTMQIVYYDSVKITPVK